MTPATEPKTLATLHDRKARGQPITMLTCYDYPSACIQEAAGVDVAFVGDSAATNVLGHAHQNDLTLDEMHLLTRAVRRGIRQAYLMVDLPHCVCQSVESMLDAAKRLTTEGAHGIKMEGFRPDAVQALRAAGIEVWTHLGYTPQLEAKPRKIGKDPDEARALLEQSQALCEAGAVGHILELVDSMAAKAVSESLPIPVIGIGAGKHCDGQVQVWHDLIGLTEQRYRHACRLAEARELQLAAVREYCHRVRSKQFPS